MAHYCKIVNHDLTFELISVKIYNMDTLNDRIQHMHETELKDNDGQLGSTIRPVDDDWIQRMILALESNPDDSVGSIVSRVNAVTGR